MKSALVIGATRGIGRQIALTLAENGYGVCVAAKTVVSTEKNPGMLFARISRGVVHFGSPGRLGA